MSQHGQLGAAAKQEPIVKNALQHVAAGRALDLGAGYGHDALYLAAHGFTVTAVENDPNALAKLRAATTDTTNIEIVGKSMLAYRPTVKFNLIVSDMALHLLHVKQMLLMIARMRSWTKKGGVNVVSVLSGENKTNTQHLFAKNELLSLYADWDILEYQENTTTYQSSDMSIPESVYGAYLLAKKIR